MRLQTLRLHNVFSYLDTTIELDNMGLTAICGHNGAGKSSIVKALLFCLFGTGADSVVNEAMGKDAFVVLHGMVNGKEFHLERYRKDSKNKNNLYFWIDNKAVKAATNTDLQKKLEKFIGLDYKAFTQTVTFSYDMMMFANASDVERKNIFEKILQDLDVYNDFHKKAKDTKDAVLKKIREHNAEIDGDKREITVLTNVMEDEEKRAKTFDDIRDGKLSEALSQKNILISELEGYKPILDKRARYTRVRSKLNKLVEELPKEYPEYRENRWEIEKLATEDTFLADNEHCYECRRPVDMSYRNKRRQEIERELKALTKRDKILSKYYDRDQKIRAKNEYIEEKLVQLTDQAKGSVLTQERLTNIEEKIEEIKSSENVHKKNWKRMAGKLSRLKKSIKEVSGKISLLEEEVIYLDEVIKGFSKQGIPNVVIGRALAQLEHTANKYLDVLSNGTLSIQIVSTSYTKSGDIRNKIGLNVVSSSGVSSFEQYSGGEKQRINVAILLALREIAEHNKGVRLNVIFLDEVLDLSLDEQGLDDVLTLLQHKKKDIPSIFILSPKENKGATNFDNVLNITKVGGLSQIS
ncbi:MAG: AAA family ATPase, partial [Candidatus Korarchaeota archaeon]|nr:AAA family ATPase [Candidatus Korarchaeota archaeon]